MTQPRYGIAQWAGDAGPAQDGQGWGPLPDTARGATESQIRLVFHTTETKNMPGYSAGRFAPHTTYDARQRTWTQHGEHHRRVGTMLGMSRTGVLGNEISVQTEIIAYSDKAIADRVGGLWVGDFDAGHYADLAEYVTWCRGNLFQGHLPLVTAYGPAKDFASFTFGVDDITEMSDRAWLEAGGILTAHGAAPQQSHWDTGELDLHRIVDESLAAQQKPHSHDLDELETQALRLVELIRKAKR
jgi:hypothetical protein